MGYPMDGGCDRTSGSGRVCAGGGPGNAREQSDAAVSPDLMPAWVAAGCCGEESGRCRAQRLGIGIGTE